MPADGKATVKATAIIEEGEYQIAAEHGPLAGTHRVEIRAQSPDLEQFESQRGNRRIAIKPTQFDIIKIPIQYNKKSELTCSISPDAENKFDFQLKSKS